jgi:hypothetical protein
MVKKNIALLLSGLHYKENYEHLRFKYNIDYKKYVKNIKTKIYGYFDKDYNIDTFIVTGPTEKLNELLDTYSPVKYDIDENNNLLSEYLPTTSLQQNNSCIKKLKAIKLLLNYINETNKQYDVVIMTRFDIYIIKELTHVDLNKFNIVSVLEKEHLICDNLYIFPIKYLTSFFILFIKNYIKFEEDLILNKNKYPVQCLLHFFKDDFEKYMNVHYICDERYNDVPNLSFYKLRFLENIQLIINKYLFTENVIYMSIDNTSQILIHGNFIEFNKNVIYECNYAWIGYEINKKGLYNLSFEMCSNKDIIDFDFIKLHNPLKFFKTSNILKNSWTKINIIIEIKESDLLCFIFDNFNDDIKIQYKDIHIYNLIQKNGFIINEIENEIENDIENELGKQIDYQNDNYMYKSSNCFFKKKDYKTYEFIKESTNKIVNHIWCGYKITSMKVKTIMKFDILFLSDIPSIHDKMFIKTHEPFENYSTWLNECKKNEFVHIEIPLYLSKNEQLIIFIMDECLKPVHFIIKNIEFIPDDINYKFISFYTQGEPYDRCLNLTDEVNSYKKNIEKYVDSTYLFNAHELKNNPETEYLVKEFEYESKYNPKINLIGYNRWKPYIIYKTLLESNDGDIIFYRDSNCKKYPELLFNIDKTILTINFVLKNIDVYLPVEDYPRIKAKEHIKKEVFDSINLYNYEHLENYLFNNSLIVLRKNKDTIKYIEDCIELCKNDNLINCYIDSLQNKDFKWHCPEQSIMGILLTKYYNNISMNIQKYSFYNRIFSIDYLKRVIKVAILVAGEMRNFDNIELIKQNNKCLFELYNCDIFISTWNKRGYSPYHGSVNKKNYSDNNITNNDIKNIYNNIKDINIENYDEWFNNLPENYKEIYHKGLQCGDKIVNATVFPQLYKIWDSNRMKTEYEIKNNFQYDLVIRFRSDMCLVEPIPQEYLNDYFNINTNLSQDKIYTLNPPKIFYPNRIYDIFYYGNNQSMNKLCNCWLNILDCINHKFDNGLPIIDATRVLYVGCLINNLTVIDISRCIGDIYRDEPMDEYINKILMHFN